MMPVNFFGSGLGWSPKNCYLDPVVCSYALLGLSKLKIIWKHSSSGPKSTWMLTWVPFAEEVGLIGGAQGCKGCINYIVTNQKINKYIWYKITKYIEPIKKYILLRIEAWISSA